MASIEEVHELNAARQRGIASCGIKYPRLRSDQAAVGIIQCEHESLAAVLHGMLFFARSMEQGDTAPELKVFRAMLLFMREFPDRMHHPKEETLLFARIRRRTSEADDAIRQLEEQHAAGDQMVRELEDALTRHELGNSGAQQVFCALVERYVSFYFAHMKCEEELVIPVAEKMLTAVDWNEVNDAFAAHGDPMAGVTGRAELDKLFSQIAGMPPPPIGPAGAMAAADNYVAKVWRGVLPPPAVTTTLGGRIRRVDVEAGVLESDYVGSPAFLNPAGQVQGGMLGAMLDDVIGFLVTATLGDNQHCATLSLTLSFLRSASAGPLQGRARIVRRGGTIIHVGGELLQGGQLVATGAATCMITPEKRLYKSLD